ncbi:MAG: DUF5723 family protein [Bacteroidales bacterium]
MKKTLLLFSSILLGVLPVSGQLQQSFFMDYSPISTTYNPALKPTWKFYFGFPVNDLSFGVNTTGINFGDLVFKEGGEYQSIFDEDISDARKEQFLNSIEEKMLLGADIRFVPFSFGVSNGKNAFSFSFAQRVDMQMDMPRELFRVMLFGSDAVEGGVDVGGLGIEFSTFSEISIGYRRQITEHFAIAVRPKIFSGTGYMKITGNELVMTPEPDQRLRLNLDGRVAGAMKLTIADGKYEDLEFDSEGFGKNWGFGADIAASYQWNRLTVGAGVQDLGTISWSTNAQRVTGEGDIDVDPDGDVSFEESLEESLELTATPQKFSTTLNATPFATARYSLTEAISAGALLYGTKIGNEYKPFLTLGANLQPTRWLESAVTYSMRQDSYSNLGVALAFRLAMMQIYIGSDNIMSVLDSEKANYFQIRTGVSMVFGQGRALKESRIKK